MIREGNKIYINKDSFQRANKEYNDYALQVKKELYRIRDKILRITHEYSCHPKKDLTEKEQSELQKLEKEFIFWSNEMSKQRGKQHKFKTRKKECKSLEKIKEFVLKYISNEKEKGYHYISKENIMYEFPCKKGLLDKVFMELNREGILSQAEHKFMHDSYRVSETLMFSSDFINDSDWASDLYRIL